MTAFFDTNIFVYAISGDPRGTVARARLRGGGVISAQVLNEFASVSRKKLRLSWEIVAEALEEFRLLVDECARSRYRPMKSPSRSRGSTVWTLTTPLSSRLQSRPDAELSTARISSTAGGSATARSSIRS